MDERDRLMAAESYVLLKPLVDHGRGYGYAGQAMIANMMMILS